MNLTKIVSGKQQLISSITSKLGEFIDYYRKMRKSIENIKDEGTILEDDIDLIDR